MNFKNIALKFLLSFGIAVISLAVLSFIFLVNQEIKAFLGIFIILSLIAGVFGMFISSESPIENYVSILIPAIFVIFIFFFMLASY